MIVVFSLVRGQWSLDLEWPAYLDVPDDTGVERLVEAVLLVARVSDDPAQIIEVDFVQIFCPAAMLGQATPHGVRVDLSLDELLPQLTVGDDAQPLLGDEFGGAK